ncbi:MAG: alpha-glucan family phosphorylase [Pseudomonadota bacterium]
MKSIPYLSRELPNGLEPLLDLTTDLRWTWSHGADELWKMMDPEIWERTENPYVILQNVSQERLEELANNAQFQEHLERIRAARDEYACQIGWYGTTHPHCCLKGIAYFSMEFGLGTALPLYAGGLGILAGDYLKAASDLCVPVIGIGLLFQEGYFRQSVNDNGWQLEAYPYNDPTNLPVTPARGPDGGWLHVYADFPGRRVRFRVWQAQVGRVTLYLLDSNDPLNTPIDRGITSQLYGGSQENRLIQEIALGICGWRVIEALGLEIDICHLNEGHAAFVTLERARSYMLKHGVDFWEALWATRAGNIFTTHTPVPAGFDAYPEALVLKYGRDYAAALKVSPHEIAVLGRSEHNHSDEPFNMAYLALRTCAYTNGVSRLHGTVSRRIFKELFPRWPLEEIPVSYITNGIHVPSWDSAWSDELWTRAASKGRWLGDTEPLVEAIAQISDEELWTFKARERADLIDYARERLARQVGQRGADEETIAEAREILDPNTLTLGFARRFAEYKRPNLLLHDPERLIRLLSHPERPAQLIIAGKAHPRDEVGKRFVREWVEFAKRPEVRRRVVFLEDYDIALAQEMVQGVDVWINTPRRPWEACGTSGMKVLANGGLNLSVLDGWWAEAYTPEVGWALGDDNEYHGPESDARDAERLYDLLEHQVIPEFYACMELGLPCHWVARMRNSMATLAPWFSTNRMIRDYSEQLYLPAARAYEERTTNSGELAKTLRRWEMELRHHWEAIRFGGIELQAEGDHLLYRTQVYLGSISPDYVQVQLYANPETYGRPHIEPMERIKPIPGTLNGFVYQAILAKDRQPDAHTPRIVPYHPSARIPTELHLIKWQH